MERPADLRKLQEPAKTTSCSEGEDAAKERSWKTAKLPKLFPLRRRLPSPALRAPSGAMGRVRTRTVKKSSRVIIEKYYSRMTLDFQTNKKICDEVAIIPTKRLRNKIAGFATHLMKRIQRGPVRGISLKLQEEERERRMDFVPEESAIKTDVIEVDPVTFEMLKALNMSQLPGVVQTAPSVGMGANLGPKPMGGFGGGDRRRP